MNKTVSNKGSILLSEYSEQIKGTDIIPIGEVNPILMGIYGEVGGIMSTSKKLVREKKKGFPGHKKAAEEEFGDTLWYLEALCRRTDVSFENLFRNSTRGSDFVGTFAASDVSSGAVAQIHAPKPVQEIDEALFDLARAAAALLGLKIKDGSEPGLLENFVRAYLHALHASGLSFADVVHRNIEKVRGAFLAPEISSLPNFDVSFGEEEQIPLQFRIKINQRKSGRSYLRWNEVFIGDPLTDNITDSDGYRFHDVFHFAHSAVLHWSPVVRSLIRQKRKSDVKIDEVEDGGRAIVVEEGLTAWIFSRAKDLNYFEGHDRVSLEILKTIGDFVAGFEVSNCPLKLWERAILDGYSVFRSIRDAKGGYVLGDRTTRTIKFEPLS